MFEYKSISETAIIQSSDVSQGLTEVEAKERLLKNGKNQLEEPSPKSMLEHFFSQMNDPLIYVLLVAAVTSIFLKEGSDALIMMIVVFMNAMIGMLQEGKAQRALDSLKKLTQPKAYVIRDGKELEIPAADLVVGDVVCLEAGSQVPADLRLLESHNLKIEESALTGETFSVEKNADFMPGKERRYGKNLPLGDRRNMAYMSTIVTDGRGMGMVTAVGMDTEIGKIAALINENPTESTPLQKRLGELGHILSGLALLVCIILFFVALVQGRNLSEMLLTAISLAVAAVPEGLPAVVTICLAVSVTRMVKVNTIIRKLPSVETLGAVSVVCSDKTGTLTQNKMTVTCCFYDGAMYRVNQMNIAKHQELVKGMTLCNNAVLSYDNRIGDPTELALLDMAEGFGKYRETLEEEFPRIKELPFDSRRKMMSTYHKNGKDSIIYTKGAPDEIIKRCSYILLDDKKVPMTSVHREQLKQAQADMTSQALRTLALAKGEGTNPAEKEMTFIGMAGMKDPIRPEAVEAVAKCKRAGIRTVMITGDHIDTAYAIARQLDITNDKKQCITGAELQELSEEEWKERLDKLCVFARVSPEHKVKIVRGLKEKENIVAMLGDGVNDAPALKAADVGISMGITGTDVARQASHMILADDNFATIEKAIEEGRSVYENIKKTVIFLLSSNLGEILTMFTAILFGVASPLKSSHILWINLITDSLPALALGVDKNDGSHLMKNPPRKEKESLFAGGGLACTCFYGILIAVISLFAFFMVPYELLRAGEMEITISNMGKCLQNQEVLTLSQTYTFTVLGMSQLFHAIGMRNIYKSIFVVKQKENKLMLVAFVIGMALQVLVTCQPVLAEVFQTQPLQMEEWIKLMILSAFPLLAHEIMALLYKVSKE